VDLLLAFLHQSLVFLLRRQFHFLYHFSGPVQLHACQSEDVDCLDARQVGFDPFFVDYADRVHDAVGASSAELGVEKGFGVETLPCEGGSGVNHCNCPLWIVQNIGLLVG
jgi:hypothetical protein